MILIKNFTNRMYAEQAKEMLEQEGIPSLIQSQFTGMVGMDSTGTLEASSGVDLYVSEESLSRAKELMEMYFGEPGP
jgi:putative signal transducing protein